MFSPIISKEDEIKAKLKPIRLTDGIQFENAMTFNDKPNWNSLSKAILNP